MAKLTIKDTSVAGLDGDYDLDLAAGFTKHEYHLMKREVGVVVGDLQPGTAVDMNVMTAFGLVALSRAGKEHLFPAFMQTSDQQTDWEWEATEVVDDADPPQPPVDADSSGQNGSSGDGTTSPSDVSPATAPSPIGLRRLDTTSTSDQATSAISHRNS